MPLPDICPKCEADLISVSDDSAELEVCSGCNGLWLDAGELEMEGAALPTDLAPQQVEDPDLCPRCKRDLVLLKSATLTVEACNGCGGVFLDAGELELLVEAQSKLSAAQQEALPQFVCDLCHLVKPRAERVVGELLTVCLGCSTSRGIASEPEARARLVAQMQARRAEDAG